uniref:Uncharacterized protein n=1 Tax=Vibrio sp. 23023 TaxID=452803 RepID=A9M4S2_9VIBR|nr:type II secretion system F family protein [Vibrio sp. 23023]ABX76996.1 Hypothetical protein BMSA_0054 [Vibrio sp. 23023]
MDLTQRFFDHKKQQALLHEILRLSQVGIHQRDIALQFVRYGNATKKRIGQDMLMAIDQGEPLSNGLASWLNRLVWESLYAGEQSGDFLAGLENAEKALHTHTISTTLLIKSLLKPILGIVLMLFLSACCYWYFFPMMRHLVPQTQWSDAALFAYHFGEFWAQHGQTIGGGLALILVGIFVSLPLAPLSLESVRRGLDTLPIFRHYRLLLATNFLHSMANMTRAGLGIREAAALFAERTSPYMRWHIQRMITHIDHGENNIGEILNTSLMDARQLDTVKIIGLAGRYDETFQRCATYHADELERSMARLRHWGANTIKLTGAMIALIMGGAMAQLIVSIITHIHM